MIKKFFLRLYQPERIVISAAGKLGHQRLVDLVRPAFKTIKPGNAFPQRMTPQGCSVVDLNHRDLEQMHICLSAKGLSIIDHRRYAFSLLNTILGGNMSSRLFQEVREKRGLAYSVYSFISSHGDTGMFGVYVGVAPVQAQETTRLVLDEIHRLKTEFVEPTELTGAIEYTKGGLMLASESIDNQMVRCAQNEIHFGREIPLQEIIENVEAVSREDILELANDLFHPRQMALTLLGPLKNSKEELETILFDSRRL
jgi:predicted Zn-dependent peptidase